MVGAPLEAATVAVELVPFFSGAADALGRIARRIAETRAA
jgi:hypothetical protein